jgi:tRNA(fMet)-specific endonuclease VapC
MNGKYLLDTNIVISLLRKDNEIVEKIEELDEAYIPVTVIGELYFGAFKSKKVEENLQNISNLLENIPVLANSVSTARIYGEIKNQLKENEKPIPENDIWIAAIAKQYELTVMTNDIHFKEVEGLKPYSI